MKKPFAHIAMCLVFAGANIAAAAAEAVAPLRQTGLPNQVCLGYQFTDYDYELKTANGVTRATANGINAEFRYHTGSSRLGPIGALRYSTGSPLGQTLGTAAAGASYVRPIGRWAPFAQAMGGVARLTSTDQMYLQQSALTGFTTLLGVGVDVQLSSHWGVRPIYIENQYLPSFGPHGSVYWNAGGGVLFRFDSFGHRR